MRSDARNRGFSLLELMAVMAILAVLSTVAIFSYKSYLRKARNAEGVAFLMDIKMKQETYFMAYSRYVSTGATTGDFIPNPFPYAPYPWNAGGSPWDCSNPSGDAMTGLCALGITPTSEDTWFQYSTTGWFPGTTVNPAPFITHPERRWWFARARGYAGTSTAMTFEYRISSEVSEIIEIPPE